ncbi:MAG: hypothetical protein GX316_02285 [Firmicutes bacterium]|nr:hypothetical protein [Bacillota bacterium]
MGTVLIFGTYLGLLGYIFAVLTRTNRATPIERHSQNRGLAVASLLAASAAILQAAPVYLPGVGMALSPLSSIPIIVGTLLFREMALPMFLTSGALLFIASLEEAVIFLLATGPLGVSVAFFAASDMPLWQRLLFPAVLLTSGIALLTFSVGLPGLQSIVSHISVSAFVGIFLFSLAYTSLFLGIAHMLQKRTALYLDTGISAK